MEAAIDVKFKAVGGRVGVTLDGIRVLLDACLATCPQASTQDFAKQYVMPATKSLPAKKRNWVYLEGGKYCAKFTYFISHTWGASAAMLLEAIIVHGENVGGNPVYYLDIVSEDQHELKQVSVMGVGAGFS